MAVIVVGHALDDRIVSILWQSINHMNNAFSIARIIEHEDRRKGGSMHLAVKLAARRLEAAGKIIILGPRDEHDSHRYFLSDEMK